MAGAGKRSATLLLNKALLDKGDDSTSNAIISAFRGVAASMRSPAEWTISSSATRRTTRSWRRDCDGSEKGVLAANPPVERLI